MMLLSSRYQSMRLVLIAALGLLLYSACADASYEPPKVSLLDAIAQEDMANVRLHMETGTNPNKSFMPKGFPFEGASALHLAVLMDNSEMLSLLISGGADINIKSKDSYKSTPLIWAGYWGKVNSARTLIQEGADLKKSDILGTDVYAVLKVKNIFVPDSEIPDLNKKRTEIYNLLP